jgi:uncharacterized membrane protein
MPTSHSTAFFHPPVLPAVRSIGWKHPLSWLARGARDMARAPWLSLAHGLVLTLIGFLILTVGHNRFWLMAGALSGFLIVGPVVATSLYAISRALERGERADLSLVRSTWTRWQSGHAGEGQGGYWCLVQFGLLLSLAATGWVLVSASLITVLSPVRIATPADFVQHVVLARDGQLFAMWLALGSFLAAPIFASSVVAMLANPVPLALWAALIVLLTLLGLGSWMLGLVAVMPLLGHASWHAYRDLVDASAFPER